MPISGNNENVSSSGCNQYGGCVLGEFVYNAGQCSKPVEYNLIQKPRRSFLWGFSHLLMDMEDTRTDIRDDNGRWLTPPPGSEKTRITAATARTMAQRRWEKYRQQA